MESANHFSFRPDCRSTTDVALKYNDSTKYFHKLCQIPVDLSVLTTSGLAFGSSISCRLFFRFLLSFCSAQIRMHLFEWLDRAPAPDTGHGFETHTLR